MQLFAKIDVNDNNQRTVALFAMKKAPDASWRAIEASPELLTMVAGMQQLGEAGPVSILMETATIFYNLGVAEARESRR